MPAEIKSKWFRMDPSRFAKVTYARALKQRWYILSLLWLLLAGLLAELILLTRAAVTPLLGPLIALLGFPPLLAWGHSKYLARIRRPANRMLLIKQRLGISPSEFSKEAEDGTQSVIQLTSIVKVERLAEFTLLYISEQQAFFVPDGVWESAEDEARFRELISAGTEAGRALL